VIYQKCFCKGCVAKGLAPMLSGAPDTCSRCGEEVRLGWRNGVKGWLHREDVDHHTLLGHIHTQHDEDRKNAILDEVRYDDDHPEGYTIRKRYHVGVADDDVEPEPIPAPEVVAEPIEKTSPYLPGGAKQIWNLAEKHGWTIVSATRSRGPRVHASHGTLLSISDFFLLKIRLDSEDRAAVASWTDGKFEFAYNVRIDRTNKKLYPDSANSDGLKTWIKGDFV
jgi:hypothetical protein